jgi:pilus assembly protein CpaC
MKTRWSHILLAALLVLAAVPSRHPAFAQEPPPTSPSTSPSPAPQTEQNPAASAPAQMPAPTVASPANASLPPAGLPNSYLELVVNKSLLINSTERVKRVSVTDPTIADALVVTPTQILVQGHSPGEVSLVIWDEQERSRTFDVKVDLDLHEVADEVKRVFPNELISVTPSRSSIVLAGHVSTEDVAKQAGAIAESYSKNVVNALSFGPVGTQEILLEIKFAEVDRTALTQLGVNLFSTGAANTIGNITTGQFGGNKLGSITDTIGVPANPGPNTPTPSTGPNSVPFQTTDTVSNLLNIFLFRPDIHLGVVIQALQERNLLQILAEPSLIAVNGKESSFLAGGEFPFPIVQPGQGFTAVTIQFKEFGVRLKFTPMILGNGLIHLHVVPEVSQLDFTNALTISGFTVPALSTRRAETEFELKDGQSFVIAGLMNNQVTNVTNKVPGLGDLPILGNLFKSKSLQKSNSELMVLCTARLVSPSEQMPPLPSNPEPMMDKEKFDTKPAGSSKQ